MANRIILRAALTLALSLLPNLTQAFPPKIKINSREAIPMPGLPAMHPEVCAPESFKNPGASEIPPLNNDIPPRFGRFLKPLSPPKPVAFLSGFTAQLTGVPPLAPDLFETCNISEGILTYAYNYLKTPYRRGGSLQTGRATDCSGFVQHVYKSFQFDLPRSSSEQSRVGKLAAHTMDFAKLRPGDLLFFSRAGWRIGHVGIYLGEGKMIHASSRRRGVIVTDLRQPYYEGNFVMAKRLLELP
ncbi:MAG: NlpC/P60 family protein [Deltaproteobacteria bacterium]|nr:NlpC/P60 family protein [Deltaproteobacteria bacterium]